MNMMRLAFVSPRFAEGDTVGGAETLFRQLAEHATQAGHQVTYLTTCARNHFTWDNEIPAGLRQVDGMEVHYFHTDPRISSRFLELQDAICRKKSVSHEEEEEWLANSVHSEALYDHLREHGDRYDRLIMGPYLFGLVHTASQFHPEKTLLIPCLHDEPFAYTSVIADMFHRVRGFLFNSEPEQALATRLYGLRPEQGAVVGMGLTPFEADGKGFITRHGITTPYVMYSGRREGGKGTPIFTAYMHAFRQRTGRDIRLVFTGSGPIDAPPELWPFITDLGFVSDQEKHDAMAGAEVFIHPSTFESLGIVLLESFLAGTPALVHAGSEVLQWQCRKSRAGLWFRNYPEFEEALQILLRDEELRDAMGRFGREYVISQYAWPAVEARFQKALDTL